MAVIVQKFGGTSVGSIERIQAVADIIINTRAQGHQVAAVVSAMSGETDRLIALAKAMHPKPSPREYAMLVSTGEQVSIALLCMALHAKGCPAKSYTGGQARIKTDNNYKKARIQSLDCEHMQRDLDEGCVVVVAGFQGIAENGEVTTLGRGGSDTSGVALAVGLRAKECQIYTDVEGVFTADPRIVPDACHLKRITFEEMLELSSLGAKVLQIRAVEFAGKYMMPLRVLSSFVPGPGTLITYEEENVENPIVSGVAYSRTEARVSVLDMPNQTGVISRILNAIASKDIEVDMIVQSTSDHSTADFSFTVPREDYSQVMTILDAILPELGARQVTGDTKIAKLSIVGVGMRSHAGIAAKMFKVLAKEGISIHLVSTSEIKISVVIDEKYLELGARALHSAFDLCHNAKEEVDSKQN